MGGMNPSSIQAVESVTLDAPRDRAEALRWFYGDLAGLEPASSGAAGDDLRFRSGRIVLTIRLAEAAVIDPIPVRLTVLVRSLAAVRKELDERGITYEVFTGMLSSDRSIAVADPAGYRVILRQDGTLFGF
ncbi:MAG: VOC family protein [Phycisphaerae bacterium]|nr:MAG: VOC family protein [Phycisphaerae bacterium]MBE7457079.1 VOC family protein [Planctomycetia bacterium]MCK6463563.1 VOC family protein [Phycisphaerae bacterium]MCL4719044.1 VOC family protein [Phycisphaerae bacterium]NUQ07833.1 VOC family protein [Phycisphaerae bacterium]